MTNKNKPVIIERRFHGPAASGNGGYSCGLVGSFIDGPAAVRLRIPPPLDTEMDVRREGEGLKLFHHDELVASARPVNFDLDIPVPPDFTHAQAASQRYRGFDSHFYPSCFVCGPDREHGDGLRIFAGPLDSTDGPDGMVAADWIPDESLTDSNGKVREEYLWAALDCPGAYAFPEPATGAILLGELAVSISETVAAGEKCVVIGWQVKQEGRKHYTGTALFSESGSCCAIGYATWFEVPTAAE